MRFISNARVSHLGDCFAVWSHKKSTDWPQLPALRAAAAALEDRYIATGTLPLSPITVNGAFGSVSFPMSLDEAKAGLAPLLSAAKPAPFGHGKETVYDPTVRSALALYDFDVTGLDLDALGVLDSIRKTLVPDSPGIVAVLDKLNIYRTGEFFKAHRDTPGDDSHFGTLVVCLPLCFLGGMLQIRHRSAEQSLDWGRNLSADRSYDSVIGELEGTQRSYGGVNKKDPLSEFCARKPRCGVQWAAFFGHCEHEIGKVTHGTRVTIAYKLKYASTPAAPAAPLPEGVTSSLLARAHNFSVTLNATLRDPTFMPDGGLLGFSCFHLYEEEDLPKKLTRAVSAKSLRLKGADALIAITASSAGIKVKPVRFVLSHNCGTLYAVGHLPSPAEKATLAHKVRLESSLVCGGATGYGLDEFRLFEKLGTSDIDADDVSWVVPTPTGGGYSRADDLSPAAVLLDNVWFSNTGYFGNEASENTLYMHAALVLTIPTAAARGVSVPAPVSVPMSVPVSMPVSETAANAGAGAAASPGPDASTEASEPPCELPAPEPPTPARPAASTAAADTPVAQLIVPELSAEQLAGLKTVDKDKAAEEKEFNEAASGIAKASSLLAGATIPQLKVLLKARRLPVGGTKDVLVQRALGAGFTLPELQSAGLHKLKDTSTKRAPKRRRASYGYGSEDDEEDGGTCVCF